MLARFLLVVSAMLRPYWELTERIIACAIAVHSAFGPGLLESMYRDALVIELRLAGFEVVVEQSAPVYYRGQRIRDDLKVDLMVNGVIVIEIKAVDRLHPVHQAQVLTYLKLTGAPVGLLFNFNATSIRTGLKRLDNPEYLATSTATP